MRTLFLSLAVALPVAPVAVQAGPAEKKSIVLTPASMAMHDFSITCQFTDAAKAVGDKKAPRPGELIAVHVSFDSDKGPAIAKITLAAFVVREKDGVLLSVPLRMQAGKSPKVHRYVRLVIHKDMLAKAQLALIPMGFDPPPSHLVDLGAFYKAAAERTPGEKE